MTRALSKRLERIEAGIRDRSPAHEVIGGIGRRAEEEYERIRSEIEGGRPATEADLNLLSAVERLKVDGHLENLTEAELDRLIELYGIDANDPALLAEMTAEAATQAISYGLHGTTPFAEECHCAVCRRRLEAPR